MSRWRFCRCACGDGVCERWTRGVGRRRRERGGGERRARERVSERDESAPWWAVVLMQLSVVLKQL